MTPSQHFSTLSLHADDQYVHATREVAVSAPISLTTTFRYPKPTDDVEVIPDIGFDPYVAEADVYSRYTRPTTTRVEKVLGHAVLYPSGISAAFAALMRLKPSAVAITAGYHGCHETIKVMQRLRPEMKVLDIDDEYPEGTLAWIETPLNPTGEERDLQYYADKAHKVGGKAFVDSTFGPPPLQDPFEHGADVVMHSATKYMAGHSDCLMGCLVVKSREEWMELWHERTYTGATPGSMESWLLLRSLRTLDVRVRQQAQTAEALVAWLQDYIKHAPNAGDEYDGAPGGMVSRVFHASIQQKKPAKRQMSSGPACFALMTGTPAQAKWLCGLTKLFINATSLGGVESLIEQRYLADGVSDKRLVRLSVGLEHVDDLKGDLSQAFTEIVKKEREGS